VRTFGVAEDLQKKRGVSYSYRTAQPHTFATFLSWRIKRELVVKDLPHAKVLRFDEF